MAQIVAWHGLNIDAHQNKLDAFRDQGYRTLSLSVYNTQQDPWYACVMILRAEIIHEVQAPLLNATTFHQKLIDMAKQGMVPQIVSATGASADTAVFAASFVPANFAASCQSDVPLGNFPSLQASMMSENQKLVWFDCYGTPNDPRFIAVWWPNTELLAWNCDGINEAGVPAQQRFDGLASTWARLAQCVPAPDGATTSLYTDDFVGGWAANFGLSAPEYQNFFGTQTDAGLLPLRICATGEGRAARFGVVFARTEATAPRTFVHNGPYTYGAVDDAMHTWMKAQNIRNTAVAIVNGPRLVYAKGYTLAEPAYPVVQPTTLFRQASCSKLIAAYALYRLLQQQRKAMPESAPSITAMMQQKTLQSVLHLAQPNGQPPVAGSKFADITLFDLMTSTSGIDQGLITQVPQAAAAWGLPLPLTPMQLARYFTTQGLTGTPGATNNAVYGDLDYFLLGECIRAMSGAASFEAAVDSLVCQPLQMAHTRAAHSLIGNQLPGEALYHLTQPPPSNLSAGELTATPSLRSGQRPLVPTQYGGGVWDIETLGGSGGMSASVVDMARIAASLSAGNGNPALDADTITEWLTNAATATATLTGPEAHGFHGFDWVRAAPGGGYPFSGAKGGSLPGTGTSLALTTGDYTYIAMSGNQGRPGVTADWLTMLQQVAPPVDWATIDLFPMFGMASFV